MRLRLWLGAPDMKRFLCQLVRRTAIVATVALIALGLHAEVQRRGQTWGEVWQELIGA